MRIKRHLLKKDGGREEAMEDGRRLCLSQESEVLWLQACLTHTSTPHRYKVWHVSSLSTCSFHKLYSSRSPTRRYGVPETQHNVPHEAEKKLNIKCKAEVVAARVYCS